jgi:predicted naringenin-chalcone synthase
MIANAIFADGAAAVVGRGAVERQSDPWQVVASGSCVFPGSADAMSWTVGDHGFLMSLSKKVPSLIAAHLRPWMEKWLTAHGLAINAIQSWAIHPGGPRILEAVREALGLTPAQTEDAQATFAEHGNMSSPTVLFIMDRLRRRRAPRPCVALGFGPGLAVEAALIQ